MEDMNLNATIAILQTNVISQSFEAPSIQLNSNGTNVSITCMAKSLSQISSKTQARAKIWDT